MSMLDGKDCYKTEKPRKGLLLDKLLFRSRWTFYIVSYSSVFWSGFYGLLRRLTVERQVDCSVRTLYLIEHLGGKWNVSGLSNLDNNEKAVMIVGNHMSMLETAAMPSIIGPHLKFTFVIKKTLMLVPFLSAAMRAMKAIPITRVNPREDFKTVLKQGKKLLADGTSIVIFPQGTRTVDFDPETFSTIGIKLAKSAKVDVIPFALKTDFSSIKGLGKIKRNKIVCIAFGKPIKVTGNGKEAHTEVINFIEGKLSEWTKDQEEFDAKSKQESSL